MRGIFSGAERVRILLPSSGAPEAELAHTAALLEREAVELSLELGAPVSVGPSADDTRPRLELRIDPHVRWSQLTLDGTGSVLIAAGMDLDGAVEALSLLRTLRCAGGQHVEGGPATSLAEAVDKLEREVAWTYPAFELRDLDWSELCDRFRDTVDLGEPLPGLQRWVARLGDAHTSVKATVPVGHVDYTARVTDQTVRFMKVPADSPAADAGVGAGDELLDVDVEDLWARTGASAHLRPWYVGRLALAGRPGQPRRYRVRRADGSTTEFTDTPGTHRAHPPVHVRTRGHTGYLRVTAWLPGVNDLIDDALEELAACERLLVDLRGNVGGSLVEAGEFRDRFIDRPRQLGTIRFSTGDGTLSEPTPIHGQPSARRRWYRRTRFLTDALTYSASEDAILGLRQLEHIDTAGNPSGGGSGRARTIRLLDDINLYVSTALTYDYDGRCIENAGIPIDVPLELPPRHDAWTAADHHW